MSWNHLIRNYDAKDELKNLDDKSPQKRKKRTQIHQTCRYRIQPHAAVLQDTDFPIGQSRIAYFQFVNRHVLV